MPGKDIFFKKLVTIYYLRYFNIISHDLAVFYIDLVELGEV